MTPICSYLLQCQLGAYVRRMKGRLGKAEGITAGAHKLARILYAMLATRQSYDEAKAFSLSPVKKPAASSNSSPTPPVSASNWPLQHESVTWEL